MTMCDAADPRFRQSRLLASSPDFAMNNFEVVSLYTRSCAHSLYSHADVDLEFVVLFATSSYRRQ